MITARLRLPTQLILHSRHTWAHSIVSPIVTKPFLLNSIRLHRTHKHNHVHPDTDLLTTLNTSSKKGSRITVIGLVSNVGLTVTKGAAGWILNSASLLAEALHSFSDLLSDFVTLYTFKMSRKPADDVYPYGYGRYETIGSVTVSSLLLLGAAGIGWHSFDLLLAVMPTTPLLSDVVASTPTIDTTVHASTQASSFLGHSHNHNNGILDPNAAWFALASVIIKEWLYRATIKVGVSEKSEVLIANAWHHRSDAYSSAVALVAIVGSYAGLPVLDPLGGIVVSAMLFKSTIGIFKSSLNDLMDKGIPPHELDKVVSAITTIQEKEGSLIDFHSLKGRKQGRITHIDVTLELNPDITMKKADEVRELVQSQIRLKYGNSQSISVYLEDAQAAEHRKQLHTQHDMIEASDKKEHHHGHRE
ncbi:cation efflux family-domain-containing protein [Pilobolus umbonatus]|nr:cation efflux family-domain-containing protein [Pilobolus umbonatus]